MQPSSREGMLVGTLPEVPGSAKEVTEIPVFTPLVKGRSSRLPKDRGGSEGTKIVHNRVLPDRPRLLSELRLHCGDELPSDFPREPEEFEFR
jgi:hypothetical protein